MVEPYTVTALSPTRKIIAARMAEATRTIPHFRLMAEIEVDALLSLRRELNAARPDERLSVNDLLIKACAAALMEVPAVNIQWADGAIHQYRSADISVVTAIEGGLSTPIIRSAESKTVWEISHEVRELASRAARNALKMSEIVGGTFSMSNLGMYGVDQFDAIINSPQCAILAVGRASPHWAISDQGQPRAATLLRVTLSLDHRAVDGAVGASFLRAFRDRVEQPEQLVPPRESQ